MIPCISQATTMSTPFEGDLDAFARSGFGHVELWLTKLENFVAERSVEAAAELLGTRGLAAPAAAAQSGLLLSQGEERASHWADFERRLKLLQSLGVGTLVLIPDFHVEPRGEDLARAMQSLRQAGRLAQDHGVRLALEFQKSARFCASLDTTLAFLAQSEAEGVGVCLDLFHYFTGPSKFEDLAYLSLGTLAWVQISDLSGTPRELASDSDRIFPGDGDFSITPILDHLARLDYKGPLSLELLNPMIWKIPADRVADVGYQAVRRLIGPD